MERSEQGTPPARPRPQVRRVEVKRVERITPRLVRVTAAGDEMAGFATRGPAEHIRVFFPAPGQDAPVLPTWGPGGPAYPEGQQRPTSRVYTPRRWDADTLELDIDFVLHGEGPGSVWAERARPGAKLAISGPGGAYQIDPGADWYLIGGDESALPAIATILQALPPSTPARVYVEVAEAAEEQKLESAAPSDVTWLHRGSLDGVPGQLLEAAVRDADWPAGSGRVWVGCEALVMRNIRRHLFHERGMDRGAIHTHGYWKQGVANHPDHDLGQDV